MYNSLEIDSSLKEIILKLENVDNLLKDINNSLKDLSRKEVLVQSTKDPDLLEKLNQIISLVKVLKSENKEKDKELEGLNHGYHRVVRQNQSLSKSEAFWELVSQLCKKALKHKDKPLMKVSSSIQYRTPFGKECLDLLEEWSTEEESLNVWNAAVLHFDEWLSEYLVCPKSLEFDEKNLSFSYKKWANEMAKIKQPPNQ